MKSAGRNHINLMLLPHLIRVYPHPLDKSLNPSAENTLGVGQDSKTKTSNVLFLQLTTIFYRRIKYYSRLRWLGINNLGQ